MTFPLPAAGGLVVHADNATVLPDWPDGAFTMIYLDPPFNTGRKQQRAGLRTTGEDAAGVLGDQVGDELRPGGYSPTIRKRSLSRKLVELRKACGLTTSEVQRQLNWSASKLNYIEKAKWIEPST